MTIPLRILRTIADQRQPPAPLTPRARAQRARILDMARDMLAEAGRVDMTFSRLAQLLRMSTATLRNHFACMDELLHTLIADHLDTLLAAIEAVPETAPDLHTMRRAAYRAAILDQDGALLPAHHLLLHQTINLPPDLRQDIADQVAVLGDTLAPAAGKFALMLLDDPELALAEAEHFIALKSGSAAPSQVRHRPAAAARPRPMVAIARTLSGPAFMQPLMPEAADPWAAAAAAQQARAGP